MRSSWSTSSCTNRNAVACIGGLDAVEGLAAGAAGRNMWNGVCPGAGMQTLEAQRLGDWSVNHCEEGGHLSMRNTYFGSQLLFGADGTVVWLSNPVANTALVIAASTGIISQVSLTCVRYPSLAPRTACLPPPAPHAENSAQWCEEI